MWIKICGMTTAAAVDAALEARVDAIGFVFAASARELTPAAAAALARPARGRVQCVAVTHHPTQRAVDEIVRGFAPDLLQSDAEDFAALRLPPTLETLAVVRAGASLPAALPARLLFEGPASGRGQLSDWSAAAELARRTELVLAGGLNEANVAAALQRVRPFGVDVSSGVEERPGVKSPAAIIRFVAAVRAVDTVSV
ncbi:MAG TPA: phosphoribosylanthranilate isomerase [Steroidobacteraceae bacterium]|jgi:phosphoribosylanthranilate isomerase|nr:phosphoribosylanthranilate isomerase [Steroidobacteraceae bacterium]